MVKTTGYEFKKFFSDKEYWYPNSSENTYYDDAEILVGDTDIDRSDTDIDTIDDNESVTINGGYVFFDNGDDMSFETFFKRWKKNQTTRVFLVKCVNEKYDAIIASVKLAGGKVIK